jgi:cytochrome c-type biogenesis protein CcsB
MFDKFIKHFFSMRMMALGMLIFLIAIARATFLESTYDIQSAKYWVFNALWFEFLLLFLGFCLIANIIRYQMWKPAKIAMFTFHISFIIILIGAGITRYFSFEGSMMVREGETSDVIYASDPQLWFRVNDRKKQYEESKKLWMSTNTFNDFSINFDFPKHDNIDIFFVKFSKKCIDSLVKVKGSTRPSLEIVTDGMTKNNLLPNGFVMAGKIPISFNKQDAMPGVHVRSSGDSLFIKSDIPLRWLPMSEMQKARQSGRAPDSLFKDIPAKTEVPFLTTTLYVAGQDQFVFKRALVGYEKRLISSRKKDVGKDYLELKITDGSKSKNVVLEGGIKQIPTREVFEFNGLQYEMEYGCTQIKVPFLIGCKDFRLKRYPGSDVASSYESDLEVISTKGKVMKSKTVLMNHVMDFEGYRFFQSSYDADEKGTILSANYDWWGTNVTYVGYFLMIMGMVMSIFAPIGRFRDLVGKLNASNATRANALKICLATAAIFSANSSFAIIAKPKTPEKPVFKVISVEHSNALGSLLVQNFTERIAPYHTLCTDLMRKVYRADKFEGLNAVQAVTSMHIYQSYWVNKKIINVPSNLRDALKMPKGEKYASFAELTSKEGEFVLLKEYQIAFKALESSRNEFQKKLIKLVERYQVVITILKWEYIKVIPLSGENKGNWGVPMGSNLTVADSNASNLVIFYFKSINQAASSGDYKEANELLGLMKIMQRKLAVGEIPSESNVDMEIRFNKMNIFHNAMNSYYLIGFLLLVLYFIRIFVEPNNTSQKTFKFISNILVVLLAIIFVYHAAGLIFRAKITGYAPWTNGYEAVVFIAWSTLLAGFLFSRKTAAVLAGTALLAAFMITVTEMNLLDPEITPLQPVLKSYWLMIHVAIITSSYGFLGLACILGIISMVVYIARTTKNGSRLGAHIREIAFVSELTMTIGIFMLTIGTFLGGIWANESWGRYWGWDPKETWALVSVLVYAVVLHLRYIPGLNGKLTFTIASVWAYASIIFTFFGVNFVLTGLHSYAQGEGTTEFPAFVWYVVFVFVLFTIAAILTNRNYLKKLKNSKQID